MYGILLKSTRGDGDMTFVMEGDAIWRLMRGPGSPVLLTHITSTADVYHETKFVQREGLT
jgi:hypothetical protein